MDNRNFYTCCFTGHRPANLPWKYNEQGLHFYLFKFKLMKIIKKAIKFGYTKFISGMALGADLICAELIVKIKKTHPNIILECAIPCCNQSEKWSYKYKNRYNNIICKADIVTYVSNKRYFNGCMQKRNIYMVDNSDFVIAIFNGKPGGTQTTIEYAKSLNKKIKILKP